MKQVFINIIGHNSSGKTTLAKQLAADFKLNRVSGDDFRQFIHDNIAYFAGTNTSYPNDRYALLTPLVVEYRITLSNILLAAGENVIFDGSGTTRTFREHYFSAIRERFPDVLRVIIWSDIDEESLIERLKARGSAWEAQYRDIKKHSFEPPTTDEADLLLRYTQANYQEIHQRLSEALKN
jgi:adenylate kinase family enzyme